MTSNTTPTPPPPIDRTGNNEKRGSVFMPGRGESVVVSSIFNDMPDQIQIYDRKGNVIRTLSSVTRSTVWDGRNDKGETVTSGVYLLVAQVSGKIEKKKVVVIK
jgi:flagellar hook assembly protein FlgD